MGDPSPLLHPRTPDPWETHGSGRKGVRRALHLWAARRPDYTLHTLHLAALRHRRHMHPFTHSPIRPALNGTYAHTHTCPYALR